MRWLIFNGMRARRVHSPRIRRYFRRVIVEWLEDRALLATTYPPGFIDAPVAEGLSNATAMEIAPNGDLWVLEQNGAVKRFRAGQTAGDVVADVSTLGMSSSGERGLLGITFDPQYATNKQVYLYYTSITPNLHNRISRFTVIDADGADYYFAGTSTASADKGSSGTPTQTVIFELDQLSATNHNGGAIHFGPDGKLYVGVGENAVPSNAQSLNNVLGKILRINADGTIPEDNPFFSSATGKNRAIWALGLRNPFTFAFQPGTGRMFINDVGQNTWEEINDGIAGANYGWPSMEGNQGTLPPGPGVYHGPIYTYAHGSGTFQGFSIAGGNFYNPATSQFPSEYIGDYFFADYVKNWINVLDVPSGTVSRFATGPSNPVDLHVANDGSLYYVARGSGQVIRVTFPSANNPPTISDIPDQQLAMATTKTIGLQVNDDKTPANSLPIQVAADNPLLLPGDSLTLAGNGVNRTLQLAPAEGHSGRATVTITVSDGELTASVSFVLSVTSDGYPWHNSLNELDVTGDESIVAEDIVVILNLLNSVGPGSLPAPTAAFQPPPYYDTFADNVATPLDSLLVINYLNSRRTQLVSEGEPPAELWWTIDVPQARRKRG